MERKLQNIVGGRRYILAMFAAGLAMLLGSALSVQGCICGRASTCEQFNFYQTIFVGKAIDIEKSDSGSFKTETTVFEVTEMLSGEKARIIRVRNKSGFSCDVEFTIGEKYLVFAAGDKKSGFGTGFCSGNLPFDFAHEEISELRRLSRSTAEGQLAGTVLKESAINKREKATPVRDVRIQIDSLSSGRRYNAVTDAEGRYEQVVPPGKYVVRPIVPLNFVLANSTDEPVNIRSGGCAEGRFVLANDTVVSGRLLDYEGRPAPNVRVEILSIDTKSSYLGGEYSESDSNGDFSIKQIPAGRYTLSINYNRNPNPDNPFPTTFYPGGGERSYAKILEIEVGSRIEGLVWRLPPKIAEIAIEGEVVWENGTPAAGVEIKLFDQAFPGHYAGCYLMEIRTNSNETDSRVRSSSLRFTGSGCDLQSDPDGRFSLSAFSGRDYRLKAYATKILDGQKIEFVGESESFSLIGQPQSIRLVLRKK